MDKNDSGDTLSQTRLIKVRSLLSGLPPDGPAPDVVRDVHRGPDGVIPLARKRDGVEWEPLGAMPVNAPWLPGLLEFVSNDGYFAVNSSYRAARKHERPVTGTREVWVPIPGESPGAEQAITVPVKGNTPTGLPHAIHRNSSIRWLNVCHVDIDCYNVGLSVGETLGQLVALQDSGELPPATGFARSGGGVWAFWFLLDTKNPTEGERDVFGVPHRPDTPQRATKRAMALYAKVQHALMTKLAHLGADLGAVDAARFAPFPGTRKTLYGDERVTWWWQASQDGRGFAYTLEHLARALHVELKATAHPVIAAALPHHDRPKNELLSQAGKRGWYARWRGPLGDFTILRNLRGGGFAEGIRNRGAYYYALLMLRSGMQVADARVQLAEYAQACRPALTDDEVSAALAQAMRDRPEGVGFVTHARLFSELKVTPAEAGYLEHIRPEPPVKVTPTRVSPDRRRQLIASLLKQFEHIPSTRDMARYLEAEGVIANHTTIALDYQALGVQSEKRHGGRPSKVRLF